MEHDQERVDSEICEIMSITTGYRDCEFAKLQRDAKIRPLHVGVVGHWIADLELKGVSGAIFLPSSIAKSDSDSSKRDDVSPFLGEEI